ncbi:SusC/RagA family TonB-linked outer membrane protein [Puteibacter caeruleilacunae]|nr:SusC/RagA family TonB-linked outer membrane protein [Puteibacter caeruleilacunae]
MNLYMKKIYLIVLLGLLSGFGFAQKTGSRKDVNKTSSSVKGLVIGDNESPIEGALIKVINDTITTRTDVNGKFEIPVFAKDKGMAISISSEGYRDAEIYCQGRNELRITLLKTTDRVNPTKRFNLGYVEQESRVTTSSVAGIGDDKISAAKESVEQNLQGQIAGVNVINRSGMPGEGAYFDIRGLSSLFAGNSPLIILDGVYVNMNGQQSPVFDGVFSNPFANLNVSDIENITVLKGAETAAYGSLGANGIVIIDTKESDGLETSINVSMQGGVCDAPKSIPLLNSGGFTSLMTELAHQKYSMNEVVALFPGLVDDKSMPQYYTYANETEWQDEIFGTGAVQDYFVNVKGGDAVAHYSLSLGYHDVKGILENTDLSRYTTHINATINVSPKVKLWTSLGYNINKRSLKEQGIETAVSPLYSTLFKAPSMAPYSSEALTGNKTVYLEEVKEFDVSNPTALVQVTDNFEKSYNIFASLGGEYAFSQAWKLSFLASSNYRKNRENLFIPGVSMNTIATLNDPEVKNMVKHGVGVGHSTFMKGNLMHHKRYKSGNTLNINVGGLALLMDNEYDFGQGINTSNDEFNSLSNTTDKKLISGYLDNYNYMAYNAAVNYGVRDKYFATVICSTDRSSVFGDNGAFEIYPAVSLGWRLSSEEFLKNKAWLNDLKLRAGVGRAGNSNVASSTGQYFFTSKKVKSINGIVRNGIPNGSLNSEKREMLNLGLDWLAFDNRVDVKVDGYIETSKDMMVNKSTSDFLGYSSFLMNGGEMQNKGVEISANFKVVNHNDFDLTVGGNISFSNSEIKSLGGDQHIITDIPGGSVISVIGGNPYEFYGFKTTGVFATQAEADAAGLTNSAGVQFGAGDVTFVDKDGNGIINNKDRFSLGSATPDMFGGFYVDVDFKDFFLTGQFTFSKGAEVYNYMRAQLESMSDLNNQATSVTNRWMIEGQQTNMPKATYGDPMGNGRFSDRWIEDGSYLKLKSLTLGYNLPKNWLGFVQDGIVFVTGENLLTMFSDYLGYDPEFNYSSEPVLNGVDYGKVPLARSIMLGVKVTL